MASYTDGMASTPFKAQFFAVLLPHSVAHVENEAFP
jgi:hypothetical protein